MRKLRRAGTLILGVLLCLHVQAAPFLVAPLASAQENPEDALFRAAIEYGMGLAYDETLKRVIGPAVSLTEEEEAWLYGVFKDLVGQARRRDIRYTLQVLDNIYIANAFSVPGGFIYVTTALLKNLGNDTDALANVLAHEIAHFELRHHLETNQRFVELWLWTRFGSPETQQGETWDFVQQTGLEVISLGWNRLLELEADALGQQLAAAAGYDPHGLSTFFKIVRLLEILEPQDLGFQTHPPTPERIQRASILAERLPIAERKRPKPEPPSDAEPIETVLLRLWYLVEESRK